jgi:hypothetical protein
MTVDPMTDAELERWERFAPPPDEAAGICRDVMSMLARIRHERSRADAAEAERDAAVARAMPEARLMRTVEDVEALADGPILFRWSAAVVANSGTRVAVKSGRLILLDGYSQQLSWLTQAYVVALPDLPTPTAAQEATDAE